MRKRCRQTGFLLLVLSLMSFFFFTQVSLLWMIEMGRDRIISEKKEALAESLAESGIAYAKYMIREGKWRPGEEGLSSSFFRIDKEGKTEIRKFPVSSYTSPIIDGEGYFAIEINEVSYHRVKIKSIGVATEKIKRFTVDYHEY